MEKMRQFYTFCDVQAEWSFISTTNEGIRGAKSPTIFIGINLVLINADTHIGKTGTETERVH